MKSKKMSSNFISCYNEKKELEHFKVPYEVYIYIRQLENEIINRNGAVQRLYDFRFGENYGGNTPIVPDDTMEEILKNGVKK
jgi:hypothetical protein